MAMKCWLSYFVDGVNGADIGVIQRGGGAGFALEAFEGWRIGGHAFGQKFESYAAAEIGVFGFVDHAHAATAKFFLDAIVGNSLSVHRVRKGKSS